MAKPIKTNSHIAPFQGSYKVSNLPIISTLLSAVSIAFCYVMSQYLNQEPPFPGASITNTSNHFPQFIVFRIAEEGTALISIIIWTIEYSFIQMRAQESHVELFFPSLQAIIGAVSNVLFVLSTASIDTGDMNGHFHGKCASWFFITTMGNFVLNFYSYYQFKQQNAQAICDNSYYVKLLINVLDILLVLLDGQHIPHYNNIKEYLGVVFVMIYMLTFAYDWRGYTIKFSMESSGFIKFTRDNQLATPLHAQATPVYVQMPMIPQNNYVAQSTSAVPQIVQVVSMAPIQQQYQPIKA